MKLSLKSISGEQGSNGGGGGGGGDYKVEEENDSVV